MIINIYIKLGIGDWGLGIGDWGLGAIPNPQSPIDIIWKISKNYYILLINFWINKKWINNYNKINVFVLNPYLDKEQNLIGWKFQIRDKSSA